MGFITPQSNKITLMAFLTQKGREYLVNGQPDDFKPRYFSLGDPDTNYLQASQDSGTASNTLPAGFVPDLSGDYDGAIHSLAGGVVQRSFLHGGSGVDRLGTNKNLGGGVSAIGFGPNRVDTTRISAVARPGVNFNIPVTVQVLSSGVAGGEQVRLYLVPPSRGTFPGIYPYLSFADGGIVKWDAGDANLKYVAMVLSMPILPAVTRAVTAQGGYRFYAYVMAVPYKSSVVVPAATGVFAVEIFLSLSAGSSGASTTRVSTLPAASAAPAGN